MPFDYSSEPEDGKQFTGHFNAFYSRFARLYDRLIKIFPLWRNWLDHALPWIQGPRVLEVSFGTGYLLTRYAQQFDVYGVDLNPDLAAVARKNLLHAGLETELQVADVEALPYPPAVFDSLVSTMAFSGYPDGGRAMAEMTRVLKPGGCLVMLDISFPVDKNRLGMLITRAWQAGGDIIRDMPGLLTRFGYEFRDREVGGFGSVHLYLATKQNQDDHTQTPRFEQQAG
jgi:ubiquinone/menaquinone biosynthesis C-methylase UbiE